MIPIDEQIAGIKHLSETDSTLANKYWASVLASLEELKRIREVQVPEEPVVITLMREQGQSVPQEQIVTYIDTLRELLKRETARADTILKAVKQVAEPMSDNIRGWKERAEAAEAKLAAIKEQSHD